MTESEDIKKEADGESLEKKKMSPEEALVLRWRIIFASIAVGGIVIVLLLSILPSRMIEDSVKRSADAVLAARFESVFPDKAPPATGERVRLESGGAAFQFVFLAQGKGGANDADYADELIFVVPVSNLSGPAASVFYYTQDEAASFIGNCGGRPVFALSYADAIAPVIDEISAGNLRKWKARIEAAAKGILAGFEASRGSAQ